MLPFNFCPIQLDCCRGEVKIVSANCLLAYKLEKYTLGRGHCRFASLMRNYFPKRSSGASLHTMSKLYDVPVGFVTPPYIETVYYFLCARRRMAIARYRMICLVPVTFRLVPFGGRGGEIENVTANHRPRRPSYGRIVLNTNLLYKKKLVLASYHVSFISGQWFQKKNRKCLNKSQIIFASQGSDPLLSSPPLADIGRFLNTRLICDWHRSHQTSRYCMVYKWSILRHMPNLWPVDIYRRIGTSPVTSLPGYHHKNLNLSDNFLTIRGRAFTFHMHILCDIVK